jgi:hypothetical protein
MGKVQYASQVNFQMVFVTFIMRLVCKKSFFLRQACKNQCLKRKEHEPPRGIVIVDHGKGLDYK